jgi:putative lipoprotein
MESISGSVTYLERIMLPPTAVVEVTMADVARMDAPADVIATTTFAAHGGPPFPFVLGYDPEQLTTRGRYAVRVTIRAEGRLLFTSTQHIPALELDPGQPIVLSRVGGRPAAREPVEPVIPADEVAGSSAVPVPVTPPVVSLANTYWRLVELDGVAAPLGAGGGEAHLVLERGTDVVRGFAGCNTFRGTYQSSGPDLQFGPLATTRKMCLEGMDLERALLAALESVAAFHVSGDRLTLADSAGTARMLLQAVALT